MVGVASLPSTPPAWQPGPDRLPGSLRGPGQPHGLFLAAADPVHAARRRHGVREDP